MPDELDTWVRRHAPEVVAQARADALEEARAALRARYVAALLDAAAAPGARSTDGPSPVPPSSPAPPPTRPRRVADHTGTAVWVYGVVPAGAPAPAEPGVDGQASVRAVQEGDVAALVSTVPRATFAEDALRARLEDLEDLEGLARAHERVLDAALARGPVVPFRLCTLYERDEHVAAMLAREAAPLATALRRLRAAREWGVKAWWRPGDEDHEGSEAAASGAVYLARKRKRREQDVATRDQIDRSVASLHAALGEHAEATSLGRPHDRSFADRDAEMVLNAAYLVPDSRLAAFRAAVAELGRRHAADGLELELTGPWPAYHFVEEVREA